MQEQILQPCLAATELKNLLHSTPGNVTIIDVRNPDEFAAQHIPEAINIPLVELNTRIREISPQRKDHHCMCQGRRTICRSCSFFRFERVQGCNLSLWRYPGMV